MIKAKNKIRPLTEKEQLEYLKEFLEEKIKSEHEELEEIKVKIKRLEVKDENTKN